MKKRNRALASATVLSLVLTSTVTATNVQAAAEVTRVPGANRETTAMEVAKQVFGTAETVVLVNGYGYADAVSATPLAKALNAPILLTNKVDVPTAELKATLATLGAKNIVIVGGTGTVTPAMEAALKANYGVKRIGGASRYETNAEVAKAVLAKTGAKAGVLVSAEGYADALSVASIAAAKGMPVLFGNKNEVPAPVKTVAAGLDVVAVGGAGVLPASVLNTVSATRVAEGANRFETNLAVLDHFKADLKLENIYVAAGGATPTGFADALVASAAAAKASAPVVLTGAGASTTAVSNANNYIGDNKKADTKVTVIGGTGSVSQAIFNDIEAIINENGELTVSTVKAVSSTKIEISGKNLAELKAADVTVADHTVDSLTVNTAGTTATVVLEDALAADEETTVKVNSKEYKVTFSVEADTVEVKQATYDNDTSKQYVAILANGKETTASDLIAAGYDVEFTAVDKKTGGSVIDDFFADATTGKLNNDLDSVMTIASKGTDVYIQVTLTKGADVITSNLQKVTIRNIDLAASSISGYKLRNTTVTGEEFDQNSTKLVVDDTAYFKNIKVMVDGSEETVTTGYTVKSSNAAVVYVNADQELTAIAPGTATLTITYGGVTKTVSITVEKDERELEKIKINKLNTDTVITSLKAVIKDTPTEVKIVALDQYGDPISVDNVQPISSDTSIVTVPDSIDIDADVDTVLGITVVDEGSATITFKDEDGYKIANSVLTVKTTENADASKYVLDLYEPVDDDAADALALDGDSGLTTDNFSDDTTIDVSDDNYIVYELNGYTSENVKLDPLTTLSVDVAESKAGVIADYAIAGANNDKIVVKAGKEGTATIKVTNTDTNVIYTKKITVVDKGTTIKSVSFKSIADPTYGKTFDYKSALTTTGSGNDPKVSGITLSKSVSQPIRIQLQAGGELEAGTLYIDKDADGLWSDGDKEIGRFVISAVGTIGGEEVDYSDVYDLEDGVTVESGDDGTIIFKVVDTDGKAVASKSVEVDF
ncbi:cell wall-binding repeat-containing protein [Clostridium sp. HMP27]|uniref:cell wall-binding repeat-containing protein n=1 Tax=Clostridium sp. HMP27 TaxID=1487921 RepID=UPI0009DFAFB8|nr:cell wall-binding repeat-containing protein [Clostridium sp. HMP27]